MKLLEKLLKNRWQRSGIAIAAIVIFIAVIFTFIVMELVHNRQIEIHNYLAQQQEIVNQASLRMEEYLNTQQVDIDTAIDKTIGNLDTTGSSYWFVVKNTKMIFVKNEESTKLFEYINFSTFLQQNNEEGIKTTYSSFESDNCRYILGNCTTLGYISDYDQLFRHQIYIILPLILICLFFLVLILYAITRINQQEDKIHQLNSEALERNITIEQLSTSIKKSRLNEVGEVKKLPTTPTNTVIYNKDVLASLLDKISKEKVVPLTIVVVEFKQDNKKLISEDYKNILKTVSRLITVDHVLAEILPGVYTILMFHTSTEQKQNIQDTLVKDWVLPLKRQKINVRIGISCMEDEKTDVKNIFETVYKEVLNRRSNKD